MYDPMLDYGVDFNQLFLCLDFIENRSYFIGYALLRWEYCRKCFRAIALIHANKYLQVEEMTEWQLPLCFSRYSMSVCVCVLPCIY